MAPLENSEKFSTGIMKNLMGPTGETGGDFAQSALDAGYASQRFSNMTADNQSTSFKLVVR